MKAGKCAGKCGKGGKGIGRVGDGRGRGNEGNGEDDCESGFRGEREELAERSERTGSALEEGREALVTSESKRRSWEREKREGKESEERRWREEWR